MTMRMVRIATAIIMISAAGVVSSISVFAQSLPELTSQTFLPASNASSPNVSAVDGVSCSTTGHCAAVGNYPFDAQVDVSSNGQWTAVSPNVPTDSPTGSVDAVLRGVSCVPSSGCIAVGDFDNPVAVEEPMIVPEDGGSWPILIPPVPPGPGPGNSVFLNQVGCTADGACVVAGWYEDYENSIHYPYLAEGSGTT